MNQKLRRVAFLSVFTTLLGCSEPSPSRDEPKGATHNSLKSDTSGATPSTPAGLGFTKPPADPSKLRRTLGIVLYPAFELLDVFGPAQMLGHVGLTGTSSLVGNGVDIVMIAETAGPVTSAQGPKVVANYGFDNAPSLDLLMVPGGIGTIPELLDSTLLDFIRARATDAELVISVCTGSALLAKAGLLDGYKATSNKRYFTLARVSGPNVDWVEKARWVEDRNRITSSGISAGIDMSLAVISRLWGDQTATDIAHDMEYTWHRDPTDDPFFEP
jgi:transcriptional regulator GlxA family with amidase domain